MKTLLAELRSLATVHISVSHNVATCCPRPFTYEETYRAQRACSEAAKRLEEAEDLLKICEQKIEAYKKEARNKYPGGPLLQMFMPRLREYLSASARGKA